MNLRDRVIRTGVGEYITIPPLVHTRKNLNAVIYMYLLINHRIETNVRQVAVNDGTDDEWLDGLSTILLPFLERFSYVKKSR